MKRTAIPPHTRKQLAEDPFMQHCCVADDSCAGRVEWHHALIFAGLAVQAWWAILPCCTHHHAIADRKDIRTKLVKLLKRRGGIEVKEFEKVQKIR